jgi:hypothetical protein
MSTNTNKSSRLWTTEYQLLMSMVIFEDINAYVDCVMVIGSEKGYIYPYDIMTDLKTKQVSIAHSNILCTYSKHLTHKMRVEREAQPRLIS